MLQKIRIQNFKSIVDDTLELGRVNVFIGENGSGKSNILEAVAFAGTAIVSNTIDKDILFGKGVRIAKPSLMVNSFNGKKVNPEVNIQINTETEDFTVEVFPDSDDIHSAKWMGKKLISNEDAHKKITSILENTRTASKELDILRQNYKLHQTNFEKKKEEFEAIKDNRERESAYIEEMEVFAKTFKSFELLFNESTENQTKNADFLTYIIDLSYFLIYCINTPALRGLSSQSHKDPVGIFGEGLDVLMANFDKEERAQLAKYNYMIDWLEDFMLDTQDVMKLKGYKLNRSKSTLYFSDKYMAKKNNVFSSENANEGILHVLFYLSVLISKRTPKFFAIDNIESCLNPHLCRHLMMEICQLAKDTDKQLMITTHNPAILDGLNLFDDEVRLFEVKRNEKGHTVTRRIKIKPDTNLEKYKLSELWTRGYLGAIAENF
jgi:AAA15 family ATPase/GTPase